jgi:esterase/lipase
MNETLRLAVFKSVFAFSALLLSLVSIAHGDQNLQAKSTFDQGFKSLYKTELGSIQACTKQIEGELKVCSKILKNEGNAPYVLHAKHPKAVVVLFHGLSDSPFFMRSIAEYLQSQGYTAIVGLTPGHGKYDADADMEDPQLKERWLTHSQSLIQLAKSLDSPLFIGGFSTGGAFATHYMLNNPGDIQGLLLFSGALQLADNAESMSKVWGMKWITKWFDGEYPSQGPNPYKYPSVGLYSALVLMDVINDIRDKLAIYSENQKTLTTPIFAAHSAADKTTLIEGVENLMENVDGEHSLFKIDESYDVCHADLPISSVQIVAMKFNKSLVKEHEKCAVPQANPLHQNMLNMMMYFLERHTQH